MNIRYITIGHKTYYKRFTDRQLMIRTIISFIAQLVALVVACGGVIALMLLMYIALGG